MDIAPEAATLTIGIKNQGLAQAQRELEDFGARGEAVGQRVGAAGTAGAAKFAQAFTQSSTAAAQAQRLSSQEIANAASRYDALYGAQTRVTDSTRAITLAQMQAIEMDRARSAQLTDSTRQMTLAQLEAIKLNETMDASAGAFDTSGAGLGRLRMGFTSLIATTSGTLPVFDRLLATMGTIGLGGGIMIGVLGALAGVAEAYHLLTEGSKNLDDALKNDTLAFEGASAAVNHYRDQLEAAGRLSALNSASGAPSHAMAPTPEMQKVAEEADKLNQSLVDISSSARGLQLLFDRAFSIGNGEKFYEQLLKIQDEFRTSLDAKHFIADVLQLKTAVPGYEQFVNQLVATAGAAGGLTHRLQELNSTRLESTGVTGKDTEAHIALVREMTNAESVYAAYTRGGKEAADQQRIQNEALDRGRTLWAEWIKSPAAAKDAMLTFDQAMAAHNGTAQLYVAQATQALEATKHLADATRDATSTHREFVAAMDALRKSVEPGDTALTAFDDRVKQFLTNTKLTHPEVAQFTAEAARLRPELVALEATKAHETIAKFNAEISTSKVDDMTAALKRQNDEWEQYRKSLIPLHDPALLADFDAMRDRFNANQQALIALQPSIDQATQLEHQFGLSTNQNYDSLGTLTDQYWAANAALLAATMSTQKGTTAHEEAQKALDAVNKSYRDFLALVTKPADQEDLLSSRADAAAQHLKDTLEKDMLHAVENFTQHGVMSFQSFFRDAAQLSVQFSQAFANDTAQQTAILAEATKKKDADLIASTNLELSHLKLKKQAAEDVAIALAAAAASYNIGAQSGNSVMGAVGGAASGGAAGFEIGGQWGAVAGSILGAAAGLLGASSAQKKAAEAEQKAAEQAHLSLLQMNAQAGTGTAVESSVAQAKAQADALYNAIDAALPGLKNQTEREKEMAQVRADETLITQQLIEADKAARLQFNADLQVRQLRAQGDVAAATALAQTTADQKEYADAVKQFGKTSVEVANVLATQVAEAEARAKAEAEATRQLTLSLDAREAYAKGLKDEGDAITRRAAEEKELFDDAAAGYTKEQLARVAYIQGLEDQAAAQAKAAAALERYTVSVASLTATFDTLIGNTDDAARASLAEQQRVQRDQAATDHAPPDELALIGVVQMFQTAQLESQIAIKHQTDVLNAQLKIATDALNVAKTQLQTDTQAAQTLSKYSASLGIGSLSPLSPVDQLAQAKAQRDSAFARAQGGDASAASDFTAADQTYLQLDRGYNASGGTYASDFAASQKMASDLAAQYGKQETIDQQQLDALQSQVNLLQSQLDALNNANTLAKATRDAVIAELQKQRDATLAPNGALLDSINALLPALTGMDRDVVQAQRDLLVGDQNNLNAATQAEITAINSGASAAQIAALDQLRVLEQQKTSVDDGFAQQIMTLGQQLGFDSPVVQQLIDTQRTYDAGVQNQIAAINGLPPGLATAMGVSLNPLSRSLLSIDEIIRAWTGEGGDHGGGVIFTDAGSAGSGGSGGSGGGGGGGGVGDTPDSVQFYNPFVGQTYTMPRSVQSYTDALGDVWTAANGWVSAFGVPNPIPAFASGGDFAGGGYMLAGERGPELIAMGPQAHTFNTDQTSRIFAGGASNDAMLAELRALRAEVKDLREKMEGQLGAVVAIGQAGAQGTIARLDSISANTGETNTRLRRGLERVAAVVGR